MRRPAILAATLLLAAPAAAHGPFDGYWAEDPEWCGEDMFYSRNSPLMLDLPLIQGYFGECVIETFEPVAEGGDAWRAGLSCSGEGQEWTDERLFAVDRDDDGAPQTLVEIGLGDVRLRILHLCP